MNTKDPCKMSFKNQLCVYCGERHSTQDRGDHVIPGAFWEPKPHDNLLIRVPACSECNSGVWKDSFVTMSADEEYLRVELARLRGSAEHLDAKCLLAGKIQRSFRYSPSFLDMLKRNVTPLGFGPYRGIYAPQYAIRPDWQRVARVLCKVTMGLYYHEFKEIVPPWFKVSVFPRLRESIDYGLSNNNNAEMLIIAQELMSEGPRRLPRGVFSYTLHEMQPSSHEWTMLFYDSIFATTWTYPGNKYLASGVEDVLVEVYRDNRRGGI